MSEQSEVPIKNMTELPDDHPQNRPAAEAMRDVEFVSEVTWCYKNTYKVHFEPRASDEQKESFLDELEEQHSFTPKERQVSGNNVLVHREFVDIEVEDV